MSYTSGRTVKTARPAAATTRVKATRDARRLADRHLTGADMVTVDSRNEYDILTHTALVITDITFPDGTDTAALTAAAAGLPFLVRVDTNTTRVRIRRLAAA